MGQGENIDIFLDGHDSIYLESFKSRIISLLVVLVFHFHCIFPRSLRVFSQEINLSMATLKMQLTNFYLMMPVYKSIQIQGKEKVIHYM